MACWEEATLGNGEIAAELLPTESRPSFWCYFIAVKATSIQLGTQRIQESTFNSDSEKWCLVEEGEESDLTPQ